MNIQNIKIAQGIFHSNGDKFTSGEENVSEPRIDCSDTEDKTVVDDAKVATGKNVTTVVYPPFFPVGNTQDILSIERVNLTGESVPQSASSIHEEEQEAIRQQRIDNETTKAKDGKSPFNAVKSPDVLMNRNMPQEKHEKNPGVLLDLTI